MTKNTRSSGFTLVEIAIVLTIIGVIMGSGILALSGAINDARYRSTRDRMTVISQALALFAQQNYAIPCPAVPPLANATTTGVQRAVCAVAADARGIVPYATLGLTADQVRDSYGNFISYTMSPTFSPGVIQAAAHMNIHNTCRVLDLWVDTTPAQNRNLRKARFCCPSIAVANDLRVQTETGAVLSPITARNAATAGNANTGITAATVLNFNTQTPVFVLVSHGSNNYGAYRPAAVPTRIATPAVVYRPREVENENDDAIFTSAPYSTNRDVGTASYFDDIVMWRTQDQLLSAFGRNSCARP